jgi:putative tricarboxylic transport membrane protein
MGYLFNKLRYPLPPLVLALVLGDQAESSFRQAMLVSQGDVSVFWSNWLCGGIMTLGVVMAFWPALQMLRAKLAGSGPVPRAA